MLEKRNLLDHGYIKIVEVMGSDQSIIEAARMSTDKGFLGWGPKCEDCGDSIFGLDGQKTAFCAMCQCNVICVSGDEKLLKYLYDNKHATPFEFAHYQGGRIAPHGGIIRKPINEDARFHAMIL